MNVQFVDVRDLRVNAVDVPLESVRIGGLTWDFVCARRFLP